MKWGERKLVCISPFSLEEAFSSFLRRRFLRILLQHVHPAVVIYSTETRGRMYNYRAHVLRLPSSRFSRSSRSDLPIRTLTRMSRLTPSPSTSRR